MDPNLRTMTFSITWCFLGAGVIILKGHPVQSPFTIPEGLLGRDMFVPVLIFRGCDVFAQSLLRDAPFALALIRFVRPLLSAPSCLP